MIKELDLEMVEMGGESIFDGDYFTRPYLEKFNLGGNITFTYEIGGL
jgi:hypothetical protein